ncbi:MAG: DHH family phosphoesterase [Gemmatales bacterium]|nr:MAG: DHH family phosphoesterase [Gemmatales bacterium]
MSRSRNNGRLLEKTKRRSDQFLNGLTAYESVTLVSHVNPDPDSLASMLGLAHLVERRLSLPTRMMCDGMISRAENRAMVELLDINLIPIEELERNDADALVMVDSQPKTGRHTFDPTHPLYAVIDHHDTPGDLTGVPFVDVRQSMGATCSVVTSYLLEQEVDIPVRLATALTYGIETELSGYPRNATPVDDGALLCVYPLADKELLAQIRNARLPQNYFEAVLQAMQSTFIYDRLLISWVYDLPAPELAAEIVDFMIRYEAVDWALCAGVMGQKLILSFRSVKAGAQAGDVLRQVVGNKGKAGGHDRRAGGYIDLPSASSSAIDEVQSELRRRLLKALHIDECRGRRLVKLREMLSNLQS